MVTYMDHCILFLNKMNSQNEPPLNFEIKILLPKHTSSHFLDLLKFHFINLIYTPWMTLDREKRKTRVPI